MYVIDQIGEEFAVIEMEDGSFETLPLDSLPFGAQEGDVMIYRDGAFFVDLELTETRRRKMVELQREFFSNRD